MLLNWSIWRGGEGNFQNWCFYRSFTHHRTIVDTHVLKSNFNISNWKKYKVIKSSHLEGLSYAKLGSLAYILSKKHGRFFKHLQNFDILGFKLGWSLHVSCQSALSEKQAFGNANISWTCYNIGSQHYYSNLYFLHLALQCHRTSNTMWQNLGLSTGGNQ